MATELTIPTLGMDMTEATIVGWLVSEGDTVEKGDPVLEIDTDKTSFEVEAPESGIISNIKGDEGETLDVGTLIAYILEEGEEAPADDAPSDDAGDESEESDDSEEEAPESAKESSAEEDSLEAEAPQAEASGGDAPQGEASGGESDSDESEGKGLRASPAARRLAVERGFELSEVSGSGPNGRVYLSDVQNYDADSSSSAEAPAAEEAPAKKARSSFSLSEPKSGSETTSDTPAEESGFRRESLTQVRKIGAQRTQQSFAEVPHFYLRRDMDAEGLVALRERLKPKMEVVPSLNDLIGFAVARTLPKHPNLNARFDAENQGLLISDSVNLGIAAATEKGLLVPVVRGADTMRLPDLAAATKELLGKAREGKLGRDELSGGTFTISNLGMMGVDSFDAIINAPEAAILAIGSLRTVPLWDGETWIPRRTISMTLSVDHRVGDGADGARFLQSLQDGLSDWELLM